MPKVLQTAIVLAALGCSAARSRQPMGLSADSAALVAQAGAPGFTIDALSFTRFPNVPFSVGALLLHRDTVRTVFVAALDSSGIRKVYEERFAVTGCGDPAPELPGIDRFVIGGHLLLRVTVRRHDVGCVGTSTVDYRTVHLLDATRGFQQVLVYAADSLDYGNPEDAPRRRPTQFHTYDFPNNCVFEDHCQWLSRSTLTADTHVPMPAFVWVWNSDTTALVPSHR